MFPEESDGKSATERNDTGQMHVLAAGPRFLANIQVGMGLEDIDVSGMDYPAQLRTREYRPLGTWEPIRIVEGS